MQKITQYVLGFITDGHRVLLIKKNRPENQVGLYNGIGGKVNDNELPLDAMIRESKEETNLDIKDWVKIETFDYPSDNIVLHLYQAYVSKKYITKYKTMTDEVVRIFKIKNLPKNLFYDVEYICKKRLVKPNTIKELFKISYLDEFGNGLNNYYIATEAKVKKVVKELFESEKQKASCSDETMYSTETPLYMFDELSHTGYVIKDVGFTLKHYIKWEKISSNLKRLPKFELIENHYMCRDTLSKFTSLKGGLKKLKKVSLESVKGCKLSEEDNNGNVVKQGKIRKHKNGSYTCNYYYWEKVSYEHDEWDVTSTGFCLVPCNIVSLN